jgi:hypothetical protein
MASNMTFLIEWIMYGVKMLEIHIEQFIILICSLDLMLMLRLLRMQLTAIDD